MARIRSLKPEFWSDRKLARLASRDARMLYMGLWNLADEWGRLNGDPQWIKGQIFPYEDDIDAGVITRLLTELASAKLGAVLEYEADGDPYLFLPKLGNHQRLEPAKVPSRLPAPPPEIAGLPPDPPPPSPSVPRADESARGTNGLAPVADLPARSADSSALSYGSGSRGQVAGGRGSRDVRATATGNALLEEHLAHYAHTPPRDVTAATGRAIDKLAEEGFAPDLISRGLALLRSKPRLGAGALAHLVHEIQQGVSPPDDAVASTTDRRLLQVQQLRAEAAAAGEAG
jgi:hypothetical protein